MSGLSKVLRRATLALAMAATVTLAGTSGADAARRFGGAHFHGGGGHHWHGGHHWQVTSSERQSSALHHPGSVVRV